MFADGENVKMVLAVLACTISFFNLVYYLRTVFYGSTRPHVFSWLIWGTVTIIAAIVQFVEGAGTGAWLTFFVAIMCYIRALVGIFRGEKNITRGDKICLGLCFLAIIVWQLTDNPLWAVIIVAGIDTAGFYPTVRKSWNKPHEENAISYMIFAMTYSLGILSIETYSIETLLYPVTLVVSCIGFALFLVLRRRMTTAHE
jgi:hypothetical protein